MWSINTPGVPTSNCEFHCKLWVRVHCSWLYSNSNQVPLRTHRICSVRCHSQLGILDIDMSIECQWMLKTRLTMVFFRTVSLNDIVVWRKHCWMRKINYSSNFGNYSSKTIKEKSHKCQKMNAILSCDSITRQYIALHETLLSNFPKNMHIFEDVFAKYSEGRLQMTSNPSLNDSLFVENCENGFYSRLGMVTLIMWPWRHLEDPYTLC